MRSCLLPGGVTATFRPIVSVIITIIYIVAVIVQRETSGNECITLYDNGHIIHAVEREVNVS